MTCDGLERSLVWCGGDAGRQRLRDESRSQAQTQAWVPEASNKNASLECFTLTVSLPIDDALHQPPRGAENRRITQITARRVELGTHHQLAAGVAERDTSGIDGTIFVRATTLVHRRSRDLRRRRTRKRHRDGNRFVRLADRNRADAEVDLLGG